MNFFLPGQKLERKWRERSAWKRRHGPAQTAYQRLMAEGVLGRRARQELRDRYESLDPFVLKAEVERRLKPILGGAAGVTRGPAGGCAPLHRPQGLPPPGEIDTQSKLPIEH
jgi:hypothetical protein